MKTDLDIQDIDLLIAQARKYRSDATGELIATGSRKALHELRQGLGWLTSRIDGFLHVLLMSPTAHR